MNFRRGGPVYHDLFTGGVGPKRPFRASRIFKIHLFLALLVSGCRESNPDRIHPMDVYYHYTTARIFGRKARQFP